MGERIRQWRKRRRLTQIELATDAGISCRHLSFIESGRARPSREMVVRLAAQLDVPRLERDDMLLAAGFAPVEPAGFLLDPGGSDVLRAISLVLEGHEPNPALALDRAWNLIAANCMFAPLVSDVAPFLLEPPVNVLRLTLHPQGLAPRIRNFAEWRSHLLRRLREEVETTGDPMLERLEAEVLAYPHEGHPWSGPAPCIFVPLELATPSGPLCLLTTTTLFGTPIGLRLAEIAIEVILPADRATAKRLLKIRNSLGGA